MWGAVGRYLVFFKLKGIMALPVEQRDADQGLQATHKPFHRTFYLHPPEAPSTVEVSITAGTSQGGILIADAAPGKFLFLNLWAGSHDLGLQGPERNIGSKIHDRTTSQVGRLWAFLTLGSVLQGGAWGWEAGSTGMLKPLASSKAASSVSCEQVKRYHFLLQAFLPVFLCYSLGF